MCRIEGENAGGGMSHYSTIPYILSEVEQLVKKGNKVNILDIGFGQGIHAGLLRNYFPKELIYLVGIEVFPEYIQPKFRQSFNFNVMYIGNALDIVSTIPYYFNLVLCADVIEHFERDEGIKLFEELKKRADAILVTLPVSDYPQGTIDGNEYETHRTQWKENEMNTIGLNTVKIISFEDVVMGIFKWEKNNGGMR